MAEEAGEETEPEKTKDGMSHKVIGTRRIKNEAKLSATQLATRELK